VNDHRRLTALHDGDGSGRMIERAAYEIRRVIAGQDTLLERTFVGLLAGGHLLIEGVPGLAKTLTIKTVAAVLGGTFHRVQFTPDLVPSDLVGTRVYRAGSDAFDVELGPVFCNFLLADEINRAPAKVQSALLEVMQESHVTIGKESFPVSPPFLVMATQNPIESEGTYALPEAQVDRFMLKVLVDYPDAADELVVIDRALAGAVDVEQALSLDELAGLQATVRRIYVDPALTRYAQRLAAATRDLERAGLQELGSYVKYGVSPRGPINLALATRALALLRGRRYVVADDLRD
jgi:MoxR-like ATPase